MRLKRRIGSARLRGPADSGRLGLPGRIRAAPAFGCSLRPGAAARNRDRSRVRTASRERRVQVSDTIEHSTARPQSRMLSAPPHARPVPRPQIPDPVRLVLGSALYVHLRGRERFRFTRQLFNHSTLLAPYNALVFLFSAVPAKAFQDVSRFPELAPLSRAVDDDPRGGAAPLRRRPHPGRARQQRRRLQFVLQARLEALLREVVRRPARLGAGAVSEDGGAARDDSLGQGGDVRDPRARRALESASRSVRRVAALSPRPRHAELGRLLHRRRRRALFVARRRGGDVRRDVHPLGGEQDADDADHPVLRRRAAADQQAHDARSTGT